MAKLSDALQKFALVVGFKRRLTEYMHSLSSDHNKVVFDDRMRDFVEPYLRNPQQMKKEREYLNRLQDKDGNKFCRSYKQYSKIQQVLLEFQAPNHPSYRWNVRYQRILRLLRDEFSHFHLKPVFFRNDEDIKEVLPKESTHSGFTYLLSGKKKKGDNLKGIHQIVSEAVDKALECGSFNLPNLLGYRTQASGEYTDYGEQTWTCKLKTRMVSMVDLVLIVVELMFAYPFQKIMCDYPRYAGGMNRFQIANRISTMKSRFSRYISLDYSHFDQSISSWLIEDAFSIVKCAFDLTERESALFDIVVHDFIHKCFIDGEGNLVYAHKGVPSGSMFTQIIDSLVNEIAIRTALDTFGVEDFDMLIMGDDNILFTNVDVDPKELNSFLQRKLGLLMGEAKTSFGYSTEDNIEFLSTMWRPSGPWRNPQTLYSKLLFPERFREYDSGKANVYEVLMSYIEAYPRGMDELIDVERFVGDYVMKRGKRDFGNQGDYLSGYRRYQRDYLGINGLSRNW